MIIVTIEHLRPGYCGPGTKAFFEKHGLDWRNFVKNGIDAQKLVDTGDVLAIKLAERAGYGRK
jgi:hypothetical protein